MKMKKVVCVAAALATLGVTFTGYSFAKENLNKNTNESKVSERTEETKIVATELDKSANEINENDYENYNDEFQVIYNNLKAVGYKTVQSEDVVEEDNHYVKIMATDVDDNIIWKTETQKESTDKTYPSAEYLKEEQGYVIVNDAGVLKALDLDTGKLIWKDEQYKKGGNSATVDWDCNTYVYSSEANKVTIYNKDGKIIKVFDLNKEEECKFPGYIASAGDIALYNNHIYITRRNTNNEDYNKATEEYVEEIDIDLSTNKVEISQFCNQFKN